MKKIFILIAIIIAGLFQTPCFSEEYIQVESQETTITESSILQNILISYIILIRTPLTVRALSPYITKEGDSSVKIPVENLSIICDGRTHQISQYYTEFYDARYTISTAKKNAIIEVNNIKNFPAGNYSVVLEFGSGIIWSRTCQYVLSFTINKTQNISTNIDYVEINVPPNDVFNFSSKTLNEVDRRLNITSNTPWQLYLNTAGIGDLDGEYFVKIKNPVGAITTYPTDEFQIGQNQEYLIAEGTSTVTPNSNGQTPSTSLVVQFSYTDQDTSTYIWGGFRQNKIKYILKEKEN